MTFKLTIPEGKVYNLKDLFPNAVTIHKKGNALYTINALNKLIENINGENNGNIDPKSVKIDWENYQNTFISMNGKELSILNILRVF